MDQPPESSYALSVKFLLQASLLLTSIQALADVTYDMYLIDYPKGARCVALAGACAALLDSESSFFQNPAAVAPQNSNFEFNFDGDYSPDNHNREPGMSATTGFQQQTFMGGVAFGKGVFGIGASYWAQSTVISSSLQWGTVNSSGAFVPLSTVTYEETGRASVIHVPFGLRLFPWLKVGASYVQFSYSDDIMTNGYPASSGNSQPTQTRFSSGFQLLPSKSFRWGSWYQQELTFSFDNTFTGIPGVSISQTQHLHYPWIFANGFSILPADDKRMVSFEVDIIGTTPDGKLRDASPVIAALAPNQLRNKGRSIVYEPHLSWLAPWWKGSHGSYTVGAYYENSRWQDVKGRPHAVAGLLYDLGIVELITAIDYANQYFNFSFSVM